LDLDGCRGERQPPQLAGAVPRRRAADGTCQAGRHFHALPAGEAGPRGHCRCHRWSPIGHMGRGGEPAACPEGNPRLVSRLGDTKHRPVGFPPDAVPGPDDPVQPFRIDPFALRGRLVRLGPTIDRILSQHAYPEPVAAMLGEAITLAVVLAGALKYDGIFTLQTKGDGPIRLIVADVSTSGALRGYEQYDEAKLENALSSAKMK